MLETLAPVGGKISLRTASNVWYVGVAIAGAVPVDPNPVPVVAAPAPLAAEPGAVVAAPPPLGVASGAAETLGLAWVATFVFGTLFGLTLGFAGAASGGLTCTSGRFVCASAT